MLRSHAARRVRLLGIVITHVLMPIWLIALLATAANQDSSTWFMFLFATAAYVAYISLAGAWTWFGVYLQRALPVVMVASAFATRPRYVLITEAPAAAELRLLAFALAVYFMCMALLAILGRRTRRNALHLVFPLRGGTFMIGQGGSTRAVNRHSGNRAQRYAVDIVKLGSMGMRADGLYPIALKKYGAFGAEVVSPCEGVISAAVEELPDNVPGERDVKNGVGNHVAIETDGATIVLAHLMKGSLTVNPGQRVRPGQLLGRVGNSGNTGEPHLHVHAEREGWGLPVRFNGRFLVRNDCVDA